MEWKGREEPTGKGERNGMEREGRTYWKGREGPLCGAHELLLDGGDEQGHYLPTLNLLFRLFMLLLLPLGPLFSIRIV